MSGFECLADLIINDDGVSACDAGYVCCLGNSDIGGRRLPQVLSIQPVSACTSNATPAVNSRH
jgi:hypothetical protein